MGALCYFFTSRYLVSHEMPDIWFHIKCPKLSPDETTGVWPCFDCRSIASDIKIVKATMLALTTNIQHMIDVHSEELGHLREKCESLEKDNASLKETNKCLEIKLTELKTAGGHIKDVHDYLHQSHRTFKDVTILVGGNDCAARTDPEPVEELLHKYKDMAVEANRLTQDVRVATFIPQILWDTDNTNIPDRIEAFNAGLVSMCQDSEHLELINNDDYFRLKDGEINDGYILQDGTHLTKNGTNKLAKSLRLRTATSNFDLTKTGKRRGYNDVLKSVAPSSSRQAGMQATVQPVRPTHARSWSSQAGSGVSSGGKTVNERAVGPVGS